MLMMGVPCCGNGTWVSAFRCIFGWFDVRVETEKYTFILSRGTMSCKYNIGMLIQSISDLHKNPWERAANKSWCFLAYVSAAYR
jgi:hypothetical protein